jgi:2'-5' RNA ligase
MRLFVALDLHPEVRQKIAALLRELKPAAPGLKWVSADALHVTLKFIGEQPEARLAAIVEALKTVPTPGRLELRFRGLGCFPNERRPRVFWIGMEAPPELARLAETIGQALEALGIEREKRAFSAHLTLARAREGQHAQLPAGAWEAHRNDAFGGFTADQFFLFQSHLSSAGAQYQKLHGFPL